MKGKPQLEPIMKLEVTTPDEYMGAVNGTIAQRRGRVDAMDERGEIIVRGFVPLSEMFGYSKYTPFTYTRSC